MANGTGEEDKRDVEEEKENGGSKSRGRTGARAGVPGAS